jgi:hypothetical protein
MKPGVSRKASTVELTRDTVGGDPTTSPPIDSISLSSGGRYLALTTVRTKFALPALQLVGEGRAVPELRELYVADLQERTLERVTHSFSGADVDADVQNGATISADGTRIAFTAFAGNLFFGDANQRSDAFVVTRGPDPAGGQLNTGLAGLGASTVEVQRGGPQIGIRAQSKDAGVVMLTISVPAAGGVRAVAKARAGTPRKLRTLATASGRARGPGRNKVRLALRPVRRYRGELRQRGEIPARVAVGFVASRGGRRLTASRRILFRQTTGEEQAKGARK